MTGRRDGSSDHKEVLFDEVDLEYFADRNGITVDHVRDLIRQFGNDQKKLLEAAKQLRERF